MNLYSFVIVLLGVAACASNEAENRPAATPNTEPPPASNLRGAEPATKTSPVPPAAPEVAPKNEPKPTAPEPPSGVHAPSTRNDATPEDQGNDTSDLAITQRIRKAVVSDDSLSFAAKNVKIITREGDVTLRGDVKSEAERRAIELYAHQAAEKHSVHNELAVRD